MLLRFVVWLAVVVLSDPAFAQAENIAKGVDLGVNAANKIADQGGLIGSIAIFGACLSILLHGLQAWAIVTLYKANQTLQDKRAAGAEESTRQVASTAIAGTAAIADSSGRTTKVECAVQDLGRILAPLPDNLNRIITNQEKILERLPRSAA